MSKHFDYAAGFPLVKKQDLHLRNAKTANSNETQAVLIQEKYQKNALHDLLALLYTAGFLDDNVKYVICIDARDSNGAFSKEVDRVLGAASKGYDTFVLYDETGTYDDIARVRSDQIIMRNGWKKSPFNDKYVPIPTLVPGTCALSERKAKDISQLARQGALSAHVMSFDTFKLRNTSASDMTRIVETLSFGHVNLRIHDKDIPPIDEDAKYTDEDKEPSSVFASGLVANGAMSDTYENVHFVRGCRKMRDIHAIWNHCRDMAGLPMQFSFNHGTWCDTGLLRKFGEMIGADVAVDSYFSGVSLEDILA